MNRWQIGKVRVTRIVELEIVAQNDANGPFIREAHPDALRQIDWLYPDFVTDEGNLRTSVHALLVQAPGLNLVVDTCIGNDRPRKLTGGFPLSTPFLETFERDHLTREEVDLVVCTHLHVDHVGWNTMLVEGRWVPTFPNARYLFGHTEYDHWIAEGEGDAPHILSDSIQPIFDAGLAELVEMDHRISAEIALIPTPGHTPGHVSVRIESEGEVGIIAGDVMHHPCQIARPDWAPDFDTDKLAARAMRKQFLEMVVDEPILVIGTHFASPTAGYVQQANDGFKLVSSWNATDKSV
jgi:glyoxylase-like metal-dependent hydrolase (beta-lactamase superfamily II)